MDWVTDAGWQRYHGLLLSFQRRLVNNISTTANYTVSTCRGLINQGGTPLNVGTGYMLPVSLVNPPADAKALFEADEGPCANSPTHVFNLTATVESPQFQNTAARMIASGWMLSGIFRAQSGSAFSVTTGGDRALDGMQYQRRESGRRRSVRRQDGEQLVEPAGIHAAGARHARHVGTQRVHRHGQPRRRPRAGAGVPVLKHPAN
jgi:hypothetical protein